MADEYDVEPDADDCVITGVKRTSNYNDDDDDDDDSKGDMPTKRQRNDEEVETVRVILPSKAVGSFIGVGGVNIKRMRSRYNAHITVPDNPGLERVLIIRAKLSDFRSIFTDILNRLDRELVGTVSPDEWEMRLLVHQSYAGRIIGKGGERVKKLRQDSGAHIKVYVECCPESTDRVLQVAGKKEQIVSCIEMIMEDLSAINIVGSMIPYDPHYADESYANLYGGYTANTELGMRGRGLAFRGGPRMRGRFRGRGAMRPVYDDYGMYGDMGYGDAAEFDTDEYGMTGGSMGRGFGRGSGRGFVRGGPLFRGRMRGGRRGKSTMTQVTIPKHLVGPIMGKGGFRIKNIQAESGAFIKLDEPTVEGDERVITISGLPDEIEYAQLLLQQAATGER